MTRLRSPVILAPEEFDRVWAVVNRTPFSVERVWVRDRDGRHHWVVVAKATYAIDAGERLRLCPEQEPPLHAAEYFGVPGESSVRFEADLTAEKPGTDVLVNAAAHSPGSRAAREVAVTLRFQDVDKTLVVRGDRTYGAGLSMSSPAPFVSAPIRYERAWGGSSALHPQPARQRFDSRNPVGRGIAARSGDLAPAVEYPSGASTSVGPAGFGALASYWSPRLELAGSYGAAWETQKRPLLPDDYDPRHLLCSPADQRPQGYLGGGEAIELINMTESGFLRVVLPRWEFVFRTFFGRRRKESSGRLVTVTIEPEQRRLMMSWQTSIAVGPNEVDCLDFTTVEARAQ